MIIWTFIHKKGSSSDSLTICARPVSATKCSDIQASHCNGRVTFDSSGGDDYSIRISRVFQNESGTYDCTSANPDVMFDKFENVRIISKYQLHILLSNAKLSYTAVMLLLYLTKMNVFVIQKGTLLY